MKIRATLCVLAALALTACASHDSAATRPSKDHQGARLVRDQFSFQDATGAGLVTGQVKDSVEAWDRFFGRLAD